MDSSSSDKICIRNKDSLTNSCCPSESTAAQESSIIGDISNLSSVQPFKDAVNLQGFSGMISPTNVVTSPTINPSLSLLNREQQSNPSSSGHFPDNGELQKTNRVLDDPGNMNEDSHVQSGVLKQCLRFDECQQKSISKSSDDTPERQISISDVFQSFSPDTPYNRNKMEHSETASTLSLPSNPTFAVSKPRGIGLHLNSIVACPPADLFTHKKSSRGMVKLRGKNLIISGVCALSSNNVEHISSISEGDPHINESVEMTTPGKVLLRDNAKPMDLPIVVYQAGEEFAESTWESNQGDLNRGRKQASQSDSLGGCKRCSCKKSKCLKLYCDCFAAGLYCADSCSCQGCFNRPEFKNNVIEARQLVESRNPLAFAPKIMQHVANSPTHSGESLEPVAQPSLRHKRGCNCRKSMCLKKYCECYEANVGCSDGCRCEGCKNVHGKKPDYTLSRHFINKRAFDDISEGTPDQNRKVLARSRSHLSPDNKVIDLPLPVPLTPALPSSNSRKNEMKSLLPGRRYVLSHDPNLQPTPPSTIHQSSRIPAEATQPTLSNHGGLVNLCQITQLTNTPQTTPMAPFCKVVKSETPNFPSDTVENDTPVILRELPAPVASVKVSSPNKKRISPPHNHLNEAIPGSSGELRSSRKFVFRSIPKFPCLDSNSPSDPPADTR